MRRRRQLAVIFGGVALGLAATAVAEEADRAWILTWLDPSGDVDVPPWWTPPARPPLPPGEPSVEVPKAAGGVITLPRSRPVLPVRVRDASAVHVRAWAVEPTVLDPGQPAGKPILHARVPVRDGFAQVDLSRALPDGVGHLHVQVDPSDDPDDPAGELARVQVTDLGALTVHDTDGVAVIATSLTDGAPRAGVEAWWASSDAPPARTDARGEAKLPFQTEGPERELLVVRDGGDVAIVALGELATRVPNPVPVATSGATWTLANDRRPHDPGGVLAIGGWVRADDDHGDLSAVRWALEAGDIAVSGSTPVDDVGAFLAEIPIPEDMPAGQATLSLSTGDAPTRASPVWIGAPRPPSDTTWSAFHAVAGEALRLEVDREVAAHAEMAWSVGVRPLVYAPPGMDGWALGVDRLDDADLALFTRARVPGQADADGHAWLALRPTALSTALPVYMTARLELAGSSEGAQQLAWSGVVHPAAVYVGLRADRRQVAAGEAITVEARVVDRDGVPTNGRPVTVALLRGDGPAATSCKIPAAASGECAVTPPAGGLWTLSASTRDDAGRVARSSITVLAGGPLTPGDDDGLALIADRDQHAVGDTVTARARAPFVATAGVALLIGERRVERASLVLDGPDAVLTAPLGPHHAPGVEVVVTLVGPDGAQAWSMVHVDVPAPALQIDATHSNDTLTVRLSGPDGRPAAGEALVWLSEQAVPGPSQQVWRPAPRWMHAPDVPGVASTRASLAERVPWPRTPDEIAALLDRPCRGSTEYVLTRSSGPKPPRVVGPPAPAPLRVHVDATGVAVVPLSIEATYHAEILATDGVLDGRTALRLDPAPR